MLLKTLFENTAKCVSDPLKVVLFWRICYGYRRRVKTTQVFKTIPFANNNDKIDPLSELLFRRGKDVKRKVHFTINLEDIAHSSRLRHFSYQDYQDRLDGEIQVDESSMVNSTPPNPLPDTFDSNFQPRCSQKQSQDFEFMDSRFQKRHLTRF